jgi:hypothetical protein
MELKVDIHSPKNALQQIKEKNYHDKYLADGPNVVLVGMEFNSKERSSIRIVHTI